MLPMTRSWAPWKRCANSSRAVIIVSGRQTLESASASGCHVPDFLQKQQDRVEGLFVPDGKRAEEQQDLRNVTGRLHAALRVTRLPGNELRLEIRDCTRRRADGTTFSMPMHCHARVLRHFQQLTVKDDEWTELQHGDVIHVCQNRPGGAGQHVEG